MYGWKRYLSIENDFIKAQEYVSFDISNAYSEFFSKAVILLGSEIEAAFKKLCNEINGSTPGNIGEYKDIILTELPNLGALKSIMREDQTREYYPFKDWNQGPLPWWDVFVDTKHNLVDKSATLDVAMNMLSAFQLLLILVDAYSHITGKCCLAYTQLEIPRLLILDVGMDVCQEEDGIFSFGYDPQSLKKVLK